jgi:hypothetical protein
VGFFLESGMQRPNRDFSDFKVAFHSSLTFTVNISSWPLSCVTPLLSSASFEHMAEEQLTVLPESNENHGLFFIFPVAY